MKLIINKTHKRNLIATAEFTVTTVAEYQKALSKFNIEIDEVDAHRDLRNEVPVELTVAVEFDYNPGV